MLKEVFKKKNIKNIESFKTDVRKFAKDNDLIFQESDESEQTKWVCQMKKESKITLGLTAKAITVIIDDFSEDTLKISVGEGKWISKIAGSAATMVLAGPLLLVVGATTVTGIFGQIKLINKINNLVEVNFD